MRTLLIKLIQIYRFVLSPLLTNNCRFYPTCSSYAETALQRFGLVKGTWMAMKRICRCHPWHEGGIDPVPEIDSEINKATIKEII